MSKIFFLIIISLTSFADSFITKKEYAQNLYFNPRGIGCHLCHGEKGEGKLLAKYKDEGEIKEYYAKSIKDTPYADFYKQLNVRVKGMPRYYLTKDEIQTLYYYLHYEDKKNSAKTSR